MALTLLVLLVVVYLLFAVGVSQYTSRTRWLLLGATVAFPGLAYLLL